MKCWFFLMLLMTTAVISGYGQSAVTTNILIRLVGVSHGQTESSYLIANFVPVRIFSGGGGAPIHPPSETRTGEEFTIAFRKPMFNAHEQTLCNVISSCEGARGSKTLKLDLLLSVPADVQKPIYDSERDFSQWIVQSVEIHK